MHIYIDLGTSNFRAASRDGKSLLQEPAVVAYPANGSLSIGQPAADMVGRNPETVRLTSPVDGGIIRDFDAAVEIIKYTVRKLQADGLLRRFSVTMASPTRQTPVDRKALEEAARTAGARQVHFVESAIAAALGAGLPMDKPTGCLVVNLGGGVTEAAVMSMGGIVDGRHLNSGGEAIDREIVELVRKHYAFVIGRPSAEQLKRAASQPGSNETLVVRGRNLATGLPGTLHVPRRLVEQTLDAYSDGIVRLIIEALEACPPELVGDIMDHGVILTGGGANLKRVVAGLTERIEVPVVADDDPDTCVIRGLMRTRTPKTSQRSFSIPLPSLQQLRKNGTQES